MNLRSLFHIAVIILSVLRVAVGADDTVYVLQADKTLVTITNSGSLGGTQSLALPTPPSGGKVKVVFNIPGVFPQLGSESNCGADPCAVTLNTQLGRVGYQFWKVDSGGTQVGAKSAWQHIQLTQAATVTAPFTVPLAVFGFKDFTSAPHQFNIPNGTSMTDLRVWMRCQGCKQGAAAVITNNGTEHVLENTYVVDFTSNGSACTATTQKPHGLTTGDKIQQSFFANGTTGAGLAGGIASMNGVFTVASTPTTKTYTIACSLASSSNYNTGFGVIGRNIGKMVSKAVYQTGEDMYQGGIDSPFLTNQLMVPVASGEFTANANNTISFRFKGSDASYTQKHGLSHGYRVWWSLVQPDKDCTTIVVSGGSGSSEITCTGHGYTTGETILIQNAPGPYCYFNDLRVITATTTNTFTFAGGRTGCTPPNATYQVRTTGNAAYAQQPVIRAARSIIAASDFTATDPTGYTGFGGSSGAGATAYAATDLKDPNPYSGTSNASIVSCAKCHMTNGFDLKFFAYEPIAIKIAAMHRGKTETQANDIVEWILGRSFTPTAKARPWNPPYQPCPGLDALTINEWKAGCGLDWVLTYDTDILPWLCPSGNCFGDATWDYNSTTGINLRELPVHVQMPVWNKWLPEVHPADFCVTLGCTFSSHSLSTLYEGYRTSLMAPCVLSSGVDNSTTAFSFTGNCGFTNNDILKIDQEYITCTSGAGTSTGTCTRATTVEGVTSTAVSHSSGARLSNYSKYRGAIPTFLTDMFTTGQAAFGASYESKNLAGASANMPANRAPSMYTRSGVGEIAWLTAKQFELFTEFELEDMNDTAIRAYRGVSSISSNSAAQFTRGWLNLVLFNRGPHKTWGSVWNFNTDEVESPRHFNYETVIWYHLANILTIDDRLNSIGGAIDWPYTFNYTTQISYLRPGFYLNALWHPIQVQQSMGHATPYVSAAGVMSLHSLNRLRQTYEIRDLDHFVSQTEVGNFVKQVATTLATLIPLYSTAQWQDFMGPSGLGQCALSTAVNLPSTTAGGCPGSAIAAGLRIMAYYGVASGTTTTIKTWAELVFAANGNDYDADITAGASCSLTSDPHYVTCPGF